MSAIRNSPLGQYVLTGGMDLNSDCFSGISTASVYPYSGSSPVIDMNGVETFVNWWVTTTATSSSTQTVFKPGRAYTYAHLEEAWYDGIACNLAEKSNPNLRPGDRRFLPDGSILIIDDKGNYRIEDENSKVTYRANRIRDFSPHLNASDMVAQFLDYVRQVGVKQKEVMGLPLELFISWLIISAAERDNDPVPDGIVPVNQHPIILEMKSPRCLFCQRFIRKDYDRRFQFCNLDHGGKYLVRLYGQQQKRLVEETAK